MQPDSHVGLSRIDVLIGAAILACLASIGIPAVQSVREIARTRRCAYNLRQIGTALHNYNSTFQRLPPACYWEKAEMIIDENKRPARSADTVKSSRANWAQLLLPFLGETSRAAGFDDRVTITSESNAAARTQPFDRMTCPSDSFNGPSNHYCLEDSQGGKFYFARGNYAINGGPQTNAEEPGYPAFPVASGNVVVFDEKREDFQWWGNGLAGFNKCFAIGKFANGQSTMVAVDEIRAGIVPEDPRGAWALGQIGSSVTWAHGVNSDDFGPNNQISDSDDILEGKSIVAKYGIERFIKEHMPFCAHCSYSNQATARSLHAGGVNVLMLDGVVRFVSDSVSPSLWHVMHARDTPAEALLERFNDRLEGTFPVSSSSALKNDQKSLVRGSAGASPSRFHQAGHNAQTAPPHVDVEFVNSIGMRFKRIPAGEFVMGLPDRGNPWPYPRVAKAHQVTIREPYLLGVFEVTQDEYEKVVKHNPSWHCSAGGGARLVERIDTSRFPVEQVSWNDAREFCRRLSEMSAERAAGRRYRLPTEAEWEYACRSGSSEPYPLNARWDDNDVLGEIAGREPHPTNEARPPSPVGSYPANAFGAYDMRGNVFEWCEDWFLREYYRSSPVEDPKGPANGYLKTVRGWDWTFIGTQCKDFLVTSAPWQKNRYIGFRVVCEYYE